MSLAKRKSATDDSGSKSRVKRQKSSQDSKPHQSTPNAKEDDESKKITSRPAPASMLSKEQPLFPRGGGGLLTPLERKQIQAKANRDVAAEQNRNADLFGGKQTFSDDDDSDMERIADNKENTTEARSKKKSTKTKRKKDAVVQDENVVVIESLSYKRLAVGSRIMGRITAINASDLTISLPNNLTGFVAGDAISSVFTDKIQKAMDEKDRDDDEVQNEEEEENDILLEDHFQIGQFVRATVVSLESEASAKSSSKKKIVLTLDPRQSNKGLTKDALIAGTAIQAAVVSVEDHGLIMDLGLEGDSSVKGFIAAKELDPAIPLSSIRTGSVLLCHVMSSASSSKTIKLSPNLSKSSVLKNVPTVEAFLPGTLVEVLLTEVTSEGLIGKLMGMVDVTADIVHSGSSKDQETFTEQFKIGQKVKGRLIFTLPLSNDKKLGFSVLPGIVIPDSQPSETDNTILKISSIIPLVRVVRVAPGLGIYFALEGERIGFAHISRLSDKKVDSVAESMGPYKLGSEHQARILDYNPVDNLYMLSLQRSIIEQKFLRVEDIPVGEVCKGTISKVIVGSTGVTGLLVDLADRITGLVPEIHLSDIKLLHPEKKFREGGKVTVRVLSIDLSKRQIRLTLKKTLVNSDQKLWSEFDQISVGDSSVGTLMKIDPHGALVQFFGKVKGFLPVSEMSEAYIKDAREHFKIGQVLTVNAISVNPEDQRLTVSCRERSASTESILASVVPGTLVSGTVFEKSQNDLLLRLDGSEVIARLVVDQVCDGSERKRRSTLEKIRVGQKLEDLLVLEVQRKGRLIVLSNKQALVKAAQNGQILASFASLKEDAVFTGFVSNITDDGVFLKFVDGISGLISKNQLPDGSDDLPDFGMQVLQAVTARVTKIDYRGATPRFWLTMREDSGKKNDTASTSTQKPIELPDVIDPVDDTILSFRDFGVGRITKARITSVKDTQINVELAKDIQGRIDMSEIFDEWANIKDRKQPLRMFQPKQILEVRILGAHDTRNHRFLPLTHRSSKNTVFELSTKPSTVNDPSPTNLSMEGMTIGSSWVAYVNNIAKDYLMVNISPTVRGRIRAIDVSDDLSLVGNLAQNFPVGSAIRVKVLAVDQDKGRLDLTGKSSVSSKPLVIEDLTSGMILPGRVIRVSDRSILVQLSENVVGQVDLIDMADDYALSDPAKFEKNEIVRVAIIKVDVANKKVVLSLRPSKILSSLLDVVDPEIKEMQQVKVNDIVRGFVSNITDKGVFVTLGHGVTGFVRVTNLSDSYLKAWKDHYQKDQLVKAKVISVDHDSGHLQLSLKTSMMDANYKPPRTFATMQVGDVITGQVAKVETFGVFIVVDNSENVRGLCHRSEIAEKRVEDVTKLFNEGDKVKAKVLKLDLPKRRINFGMKASYFADSDEDMEDVEGDMSEEESDGSSLGEGVEVGDIFMDEASEDEDVDLASNDEGEEQDESDADENLSATNKTGGLSVGGFDWYGMPATTGLSSKRQAETSDVEDSTSKPKKKKKRAEVQVDRTGDLDVNGPQSTDDFERLLLGEPDSSMLWLQYMAFHLELGDVEQARQISGRALKTIGLGSGSEKLNIWIAMLNLENAYGEDESLQTIFQRACEYNDPQEIYSHLISIYIQSGKHTKADELFQEMTKKFTQDPKVYINFANFLFDTMKDAERARALLSRALQVLPPYHHFDITSKFAQMEFKSEAGLAERGRTIFEGLINSFPKRVDLFNIMLDMEMQRHDQRDNKDNEQEKNSKMEERNETQQRNEQIRSLFERIFTRSLKPKQAKYFFKRWLAFEEKNGDARKIDEVKAKAATWVKNSAQS